MIGVVLATHNESKNLAKCLTAIKGWTDELVVVDGESTDETVDIAATFGAKVIRTTNKANFHINKQIAIDEAKSDLILQLDADEIVDTELKAAILSLHTELKAQNFQPGLHQPVAWWIKRKNFLLGRWLSKGGQYPDPVIRLFINGRAKLPQKDVHEQMVADGSTATIAGHLLHYSNPSFSDYLRKFNTYTSFKAEQLAAAKTPLSFTNHWKYFIWLPLTTFLSLYLRHRGYVDGLAGFVFAVWSGLHHTLAYLKLWEIYELAALKQKI